MTTGFKQLSDDMKASFKQLADYQIKTENQIDTRLSQVDTRLDKIETRLDKIETHLETIDQNLDRLKSDFGEHTALLTQILARLPEKP